MFYQPIAVFLTLFFALLFTLPLHAQPSENPSGASTEATPAPKQPPEIQSAIDPARVGLAGLPNALTTDEDFERAIALIDARFAELKEQATNTAPSLESPSEGTQPLAASQQSDPRIEPLQALRLALQRRAAYQDRQQELGSALEALRKEQERLDQEGLPEEPPYSLLELDQIRAEHQLSEHAAAAAKRSLAAAQRQIEAAEKDMALSEQQRRQLRDQLAQASGEASSNGLSRRLEAARLADLAAQHRRLATQTELAIARHESALAEQRLGLLEDKIERLQGQVVFTQKALDERLEELTQREETLRVKLQTLARARNRAESALFEARQRLRQSDAETSTPILREQVAAREAELTAARKGEEYLRQTLATIASAKTLWQRRYDMIQADPEAPLADWLRETETLLQSLAEETPYLQAEIATLGSMQLTLAQRLEAPDLDPAVRAALEQRSTALATQEQRAEALLVWQDQARSLGQRFQAELKPQVSQRTLAQRWRDLHKQLASWWNQELFVWRDQGVYLRDLVTASAVFILVLAAVSAVKTLLRRTLLPRLTKGATTNQSRATLVLAVIRKTSLLFVVVVAFYAAMVSSGLAKGRIEDWLWTLLILVLWLQIGIWASASAVDLINRQRSRKELRDPSAVTGYGLMLFFVRVGIWVVVLVSVLAHFNYPITGLIGALGVGGIAVAFAMQSILADVFNSMAILLDKPFRVGDFIVTGDTLGVIEQIGVKTTQIRSLSGEQVILSNTDILNSRIRNFKRMRERRVVFRLGVVYQTPSESLERIPVIIEEIIRAQPHTRFDRAHFFEYGDFSLIFEIVYYVEGPDYNRYMDIQQAINLAINRRFRTQGIEFAYPTQELILRRQTAS